MQTYNICLQGASLDVTNRGCRALAASVIKLFLQFRPDAQISLLYGNKNGGNQHIQIGRRTVTLRIVNCRFSPKAKLEEHVLWILFLALAWRAVPIKRIRDCIVASNRWLRTLKEADLVAEIRGGDSFSDIYGFGRFIAGILPCLVATLMRSRVVMLPQTYGPFKWPPAKSIGRFILRRADRVFARDRESVVFASDLLGCKAEKGTVEFCPDVAFVLDSLRPRSVEVVPPLSSGISLIGLNVSGLLYTKASRGKNMFGLRSDYRDVVHEILNRVMVDTDAHILLVPHVYSADDSDDNEAVICQSLRDATDAEYLRRIHLVTREYDQSEIKGVIGFCDFFVGSRMHSCIAAMSQSIPTIGLAYSKKFQGVFGSIGAEEFVIDLRAIDKEDLVPKILDYYARKEAIRTMLRSLMSGTKSRIEQKFKSIVS